jgi:hypothetical protein
VAAAVAVLFAAPELPELPEPLEVLVVLKVVVGAHPVVPVPVPVVLGLPQRAEAWVAAL